MFWPDSAVCVLRFFGAGILPREEEWDKGKVWGHSVPEKVGGSSIVYVTLMPRQWASLAETVFEFNRGNKDNEGADLDRPLFEWSPLGIVGTVVQRDRMR